MQSRPLTAALLPAIEGYWRHWPDTVWPDDERREVVADVAIALSVLRRIATAENEADTPERKAQRAAAAASYEHARTVHVERQKRFEDWIGK